uniref:Uncharacterized protein n=1 Tax=Arundo donax TaxID=35708 RepID=A0A0A9CKZ8_ARUDO
MPSTAAKHNGFARCKSEVSENCDEKYQESSNIELCFRTAIAVCCRSLNHKCTRHDQNV